MTYVIKSPRKLIEVALPLDVINFASAREKSIRQGHPSTMHLWWARRPLAAARAVLFAQLVNDPGYQQGGGFKFGKNKKEAAERRKELFQILEDLVKWENIDNQQVLLRARSEIERSWREVCELNKGHPDASSLFNPRVPPEFYDPFAGGGAIPLEAQRLGLRSYASDLNPIAVLINKASIQIPPLFQNTAPVGPIPPSDKSEALVLKRQWTRSEGIAEDVRRYGHWIRTEAFKKIGKLYPKYLITSEICKDRPDLIGLSGTLCPIIACIWARTVRSPNPAFSHVDVPLASTFVLSKKAGNGSYVEPIIKRDCYEFTVKTGPTPKFAEDGTKLARANFRCLLSNTPIDTKYIRSEAVAGRMGARLMAVVIEGPKGRLYVPPTPEVEDAGHNAEAPWKPELKVTTPCHDIDRLPMYGMSTWGDAFTPRQVTTLATLSDLIAGMRDKIIKDALEHHWNDDGRGLEEGGIGATAYAEAISTYIAFALGKTADYNSSICTWISGGQTMRNTFGRQAIPMVWDFAEANPLGSSTGSFLSAISQGVKVLRDGFPSNGFGQALQADAQLQQISHGKIISTDPPYYDNIGYADLSDFFYVWLRPTLRKIYPKLLDTIAVPKGDELIAASHRHGSKTSAEAFFLNGMKRALTLLADSAHPAIPITIYYAFKQSETKNEKGTSSTGWETFLDALIQSGLLISGTWPIRTELANKVSGVGANMLASSIVLVCRKRPATAPTISRREFIRELNAVLPEALDEMTRGAGSDQAPVAPVDLSQAIIGPGMAVFSKYASVLEADGSSMSVRTALQLINRFLAEDDFDADTQFCLHWFEQYGWEEGAFGEADTLSRGKGTSVDGIREAGVIESGSGKVRLLKWSDYPSEWDPQTDKRTPVWEALHQLIRALKQGGESASGALLAALGGKAEAARQLAYRLYTLCERLGQAEDARAYNELITSWTGIESAASAEAKPESQQQLDFDNKGLNV